MSLLPESLNYDLNLQLQACQSRSRRNGKVARLPAELRAKINLMLDDGLPYKTIIEKLGPAGAHLNEDNISNWRLGGYQDHLKVKALMERAGIQIETAAEMVRENRDLDPALLRRACTQVGLVNYFSTLLEHGQALTANLLSRNPAKVITLMNSCAAMSNAEIAQERSRLSLRPHKSPGQDGKAGT